MKIITVFPINESSFKTIHTTGIKRRAFDSSIEIQRIFVTGFDERFKNVSSNNLIEASHITRSFRSVKKEEGFKGTLKLLFRPEYKTHTAVDDISFQIKEGEFVGLIGANGAGKTTLLKILSGLIPATSGSAKVLGENPFDRSVNFRKQLALVMGQKAQLWWDLPANDAFDLLRAIYSIPRPEYQKQLKILTEMMGVTKLLETQIRRLSLGERMKMEVIGALIHSPKVLFLDEPTIGLDVLAAKNLRDFLKDYNKKQGTTIILTSHNMADISELCARIIIVREGKMLFDGKPETLVNQDDCLLRLQIAESPSIEDLNKLIQLPEGSITKDPENELVYLIALGKSKIAGALQTLFDKYKIGDIGIEESNLERVIQRIYSK